MSKASEYAKIKQESAAAYQPNIIFDGVQASVSRMGNLDIGAISRSGSTLYSSSLLPADALALAAWILDTFGEEAKR